MEKLCPVCGVPLIESGGEILCPNLQCRHASDWSQAAVEQADATRARLIAEAVKAALESAAVECDKQSQAWEQYPTVCAVARQCAASIRSMSVKANNEGTSND